MNSASLPTLLATSFEFPAAKSKQGNQATAGLACRIETAFQGLDEQREAWDNAVIRLGGSIYMSYDWTRLWWQFYGANHLLRVFVFTVEHEIVGILPIYIDCMRVWPFRFRVARLVGASIPPKVFNPPVHPQWANSIFEQILHQLFQEDACDLLSFGPVSELYAPTNSLIKVCQEKTTLVCGATLASHSVHTVWYLPKTVDEFYQSLSRNERKNRKADLKKLQNEHGVKIDVLSAHPPVGAEFENFLHQHAAQWSSEGKPGHFGAWPCAREFNRALVAAHGKLGRVRFTRLQAEAGTIASIYGFAFGTSYYCELPARSTDPQWNRFSLGPAGIVATISAAIGERMTRLEGGLAHYDYKLRLNAKEHATKIIRAVASPIKSRLLAAFFAALRCCLLFSYHKVWYQRVTPHLPRRFSRLQGRFWLRLDF